MKVIARSGGPWRKGNWVDKKTWLPTWSRPEPEPLTFWYDGGGEVHWALRDQGVPERWL